MFKKQPPAGGGSNFDPLQQLTVTKPAATGRELVQPQRDGPLLLRVVDDLAQAALKARNDFMTELNAADVQRRDVHAAAKARLEAELGQMAQTAAKLSDRLFFATRGMINLVRARCVASSALRAPRLERATEPAHRCRRRAERRRSLRPTRLHLHPMNRRGGSPRSHQRLPRAHQRRRTQITK